jgi:hypothetical protein
MVFLLIRKQVNKNGNLAIFPEEKEKYLNCYGPFGHGNLALFCSS